MAVCPSIRKRNGSVWRTRSARSATAKRARRVKRYYFANAFDAQLDAQGRILIPANLRTFAELQKDVTVIGQLDHAEIWNSDKWRAYNDEIDAEVVAADVEDIDF